MKKHIIIAVTVAIVALCAHTAIAEEYTMPKVPSQIEITKDNDVSASFLSNLFGPTWRMIAGGAAADDMGGMQRYHGLIIGFLGVLNALALLLISVLVLYHWGVFAISTAHSGQKIGGAMYDSLWVPVRHATSFSLCVPVINGISLLQVAIIGCISFSINLANAAWDWSGEYIVNHANNGIIDNSPPLIEEESLAMIQPLFQAVTIQEMIAQTYKDKGSNQNPHLKEQKLPDRVSAENLLEFKSVEFVDEKWVIERRPLEGLITLYPMVGRGMPLGQLGRILIDTTVRTTDKSGALEPLGEKGEAWEKIANTRLYAIIKVGDELRVASRIFLQKRGIISKSISLPDYRDGLEIAREYRKHVVDATAVAVATIKEKSDSRAILESAIDSKDGKSKLGWVSAGLFSGALAQRQRTIDEMIYSCSAQFHFPDSDFPHQGTFGDIARFLGSNNTMVLFDNNEMAALGYAPRWAVDHLLGGRIYKATNAQGDGPGFLNKFLAATFIGGTGTDGLISTTLSKLRSTDPIVVLTDFGQRMWSLAGYLAVTAAGAGLIGFGTGVLTSAMLGAFTVAVTLMIIAPLSIVSVWLYAVLHWIVRVVEALVAGPFWAIAHLLPEGDGFVGQHARRGYILLLDILCRPFLLVFGATVSIAIWIGAAQLFSVLFSHWLNAFTAYSGNGLVLEIVLVSVALIFFYALYLKLFVLMISTLPDRIMGWIGGSGGFGGEEAAGTAPLAAAGVAAAKMGSLAGSAVGAAIGGGNSVLQKLGKKNVGGGGEGEGEKSTGGIAHIAQKQDE